MLKSVIEHAGLNELFQSSRVGTGSNAQTLAAVPAELARFALDALFERPVQAELVRLLLLRPGESEREVPLPPRAPPHPSP